MPYIFLTWDLNSCWNQTVNMQQLKQTGNTLLNLQETAWIQSKRYREKNSTTFTVHIELLCSSSSLGILRQIYSVWLSIYTLYPEGSPFSTPIRNILKLQYLFFCLLIQTPGLPMSIIQKASFNDLPDTTISVFSASYSGF